MKHILIFCLSLLVCLHSVQIASGQDNPNNLPHVFPESHSDLVSLRLKSEAALRFEINKLPDNLKDWEIYRRNLKNRIIEDAQVFIDHKLSLNIKETGRTQRKGYSVRNIAFQTQPGIYATANLYVPDGDGPFPGVINMCGHWDKAKIDTTGPQAVGHSLALNGYVCLTIDPWGSGERTTVHGIFEDHGDENNLGSALMDIGKPMIGLEISDNMRGVDLLCSLPFVDSTKIGATGASGGGTQTLWLSSLDERIKAVMMVVSAGTFESHVMGSPCICEVMPDALSYTEESGILGLIAPRALKMCNHKKDDIPAFNPSEMIRSYNNISPVYKMYGAENKISYQLFDLPHGYWKEDREALLGWFDLHLRNTGDGTARKEIPFKQLPESQMLVFLKGQKDTNIITTVAYCIENGTRLRTAFINSGEIDRDLKRKELKKILGVDEIPELKNVYEFSRVDDWDRIAIETTDNKLIPVLIRKPSDNSDEFVIISNTEGKNKIKADIIDHYINSHKGIAVVDLSGTGEASSPSVSLSYKIGKLRVISRSELWFGKTIIGEWIQELRTVSKFISSRYKASGISCDGDKETALAGLFLGAIGGSKGDIVMRESPVSYLFDTRKGIDFFSSGVHIPGILKWGDISLAVALTGGNVTFIDPVTLSGNPVTGEKLQAVRSEFEKIKDKYKQTGKITFR
jgi:hypothetical protein